MIRSNTRWLLLLCCCQLFIMLVFINYSAILPILRQEWGMNNTRAGMIFSVLMNWLMTVSRASGTGTTPTFGSIVANG